MRDNVENTKNRKAANTDNFSCPTRSCYGLLCCTLFYSKVNEKRQSYRCLKPCTRLEEKFEVAPTRTLTYTVVLIYAVTVEIMSFSISLETHAAISLLHILIQKLWKHCISRHVFRNCEMIDDNLS